MKQKRGNQGLTPIIIVSILALVVIAGGLVFWRLQRRSVVPQKEEQQAYLLAPEKVTENFYHWYIDCQDRYSRSEEYGKLSSSYEYCPWEKSEFVSEKLRQNIRGKNYDPIICAQDIPNLSEGTITVEPAKILGNMAKVTVRDFYSWKNRPIDVELELIDNQWKITGLACPPWLTPDQVAGEFYTWYINCQGGKVKGPLSLEGYCPYEGEYSPDELFKKVAENYGSDELMQKIKWGPGADPILCAQDLPPAITVGKPEITGENAKIPITEEFSPPVKVEVDLRLTKSYESRNWEITSITCPE